MSLVALPWFLLRATDSPTATALLMSIELLAVAIFGLTQGRWVSRIGSKSALIASDLVRAAAMAGIAVLPVLEGAGLLLHGVLLFAAGAMMAPHFAAQRALVHELTDGQDVPAATAHLQGAMRAGQLIGPVVAGLLIASISPRVVLAIDAATYLVSAVICMWALPKRRRPRGERVSDSTSSLAVLARLIRVPELRAIATSVVCAEVLFSVLVNVALLAALSPGRSGVGYGMAISAFGLGALASAPFASRLISRFGVTAVARIAMAVQMSALWIAVGTPQMPLLAPAGLLLMGLANTPTVTAMSTIVSQRSPEPYRPYAFASLLTASQALPALALAPAAYIASTAGVQTVLFGLAFAASVLAMWTLRNRALAVDINPARAGATRYAE